MIECKTCTNGFENQEKFNAHKASCQPKHVVSKEKRVPLYVKQDTYAPYKKDPNLHYRIVNANSIRDPGRVERFERAGYTKIADAPSDIRGVNENGTELKSVLMGILKEYHAEDSRKKDELLYGQTDSKILDGSFDDTEANNKRYVPKGGTTMTVTHAPIRS